MGQKKSLFPAKEKKTSLSKKERKREGSLATRRSSDSGKKPLHQGDRLFQQKKDRRGGPTREGDRKKKKPGVEGGESDDLVKSKARVALREKGQPKRRKPNSEKINSKKKNRSKEKEKEREEVIP